MRKILILLTTGMVFLPGKYSQAQTVYPLETDPICPHPNYSGANQADANTVRFEFNFGSDNYKYYTVVANGTNGPTNCKVVANLQILNGDSTKGQCWIAFEDQAGSVASFTVTRPGSTKTFKFPFIRSLKGLKTTLSVPPNSLNLPLCNTGNITYGFDSLIFYRRSDTKVKFGTSIPLYEYSVPAGWKVGNVTSTGPNNYIVAVPQANIWYDEFHSGDVKVRATQQGYLCAGVTPLSPSDWATLTISRPAIKLSVNGGTSLAVPCGSTQNYTFTVENGNLASCINYTWNLGSANNNWLYNGSPAQQTIPTTTNTLSLTPASCNGKPADVSVTLTTASGSTATFTVPVSLTIPTYSIVGADRVCEVEDYNILNLLCDAIVAWSINDTSRADLSVIGNTARLQRRNQYNGTVTLMGTVSGTCGQGTVTLSSNLLIGWTPPPLNTYFIGGFTDGSTLCPNATVNVYAMCPSFPPPVWSVFGGSIVLGQGTNEIIAQVGNEGYFVVNVEYTNECGYTAQASLGASVTDCSGGGGGNTSRKATSGATDPNRILRIYPNPATDLVNIQLPYTVNVQDLVITIYDLQGRVLIKQRPASVKTAISLRSLRAGVYLIDVMEGGKKLIQQKVIKK